MTSVLTKTLPASRQLLSRLARAASPSLRRAVIPCQTIFSLFSTNVLPNHELTGEQRTSAIFEAMSMQIYDNLKQKTLGFDHPSLSQSNEERNRLEEPNSGPEKESISEDTYTAARAQVSAKAVANGLTPDQRESAILEGMSMQIYDHLKEICAPFATHPAPVTETRKHYRRAKATFEQSYHDTAPLPQTLPQALAVDSRAIIVTECQAPFRIIHVNPAFEHLFGYNREESRGKTLGCFLQGSEVSVKVSSDLVSRLLEGEPEVNVSLVNYSKCGRRFHDRVRAGPLYDERNKLTHFVVEVQELPETV